MINKYAWVNLIALVVCLSFLCVSIFKDDILWIVVNSILSAANFTIVLLTLILQSKES